MSIPIFLFYPPFLGYFLLLYFYLISNIIILCVKVHDGAINQFVSTYRHLISAGDDGIICFLDLEACVVVRKMDILAEAARRELCLRPDVIRRLKCMSLKEDTEEGGTLAVGTSYGDIFIVGIGTCV